MKTKLITFLIVLISASIVIFNNLTQIVEQLTTNYHLITLFLLIILTNAFYIGNQIKFKWYTKKRRRKK